MWYVTATESPGEKNFKSNLASCIAYSLVCMYVCMYRRPVGIYFEELFGFDGLELSFFSEDINAGWEKGVGR